MKVDDTYTSKNSSNSSKNNRSQGSEDLDHLTNKKKEYLQEVIADKNGVFDYL